MFVQLNTSWMKHDFLINNFKIKNEKQLAEIWRLHLDEIAYDPDKSDVEPLPLISSEPEPELEVKVDVNEQKRREDKLARIEKIKDRRMSLGRCENAYKSAVGSARKVMDHLLSQPAVAVEAAEEMIGGLVDKLMVDQEATLQLVSIKGKSENSYFHAINVSILSLMLGKYLKLNADQMRDLGVGALFHDLGHTELPSRILRTTEPLTMPERKLYQMHPLYGVKLAQRIGKLSKGVMEIIEQHHELIDGSGYPKQLKGAQISQLARVVAIVNRYDNLCNSINSEKCLSPYEAMSYMYAKQKGQFDERMLSLFITNMGVYPPGTIVRLANGSIAAVISINPKALLLPNVIIYDPNIPWNEAPIIDLSEEQLKITESFRRSALPPEVLKYLNLGERVNYYIDAESKPS